MLFTRGGVCDRQIPQAQRFQANEKWPEDMRRLFDEAGKSFAAGAYTSSAMAARKVLMVCACHEGAEEGKSFASYVSHITDNVLTFPKAKATIDRIRTIGNDANHSVAFVTKEDAERALSIVTYMLDTIYSLPSA